MITLFSIFFSSFLIAFSGAIMPGPLLTITVSESSRQGFKVGPLVILGHGILELSLVVAIIYGLAPFFKQTYVFIVIAIAGSAILLWMAYGMFRSLPQLTLNYELEEGDKRKGFGISNHILSGLFLSLINPYWIIWWVSIGIGYILHSLEVGVWGVIFFFTGHILADLLWYSFISFSISRGSSLLNDRMYKLLIGFCASVLVFFSLMFGFSGVSKLLAS